MQGFCSSSASVFGGAYAGEAGIMKLEKLIQAGLPKIPALIPVAMRAAGRAEAAGIAQDVIIETFSALLRNPHMPLAEDIAPYFSPLAEVISASAELRDACQRRFGKPAPWRIWGEENIDEKSKEQMQHACSLPVSAGGALLPDAHAGYGLPIGGVLAVRNAVIPYAVGVDIACRMCLTVLDIPPSWLDTHDDILSSALESQTRFGVGAQFAQKERRSHPVMDEDWSISPITKLYKDRAHAQLGTSGSGNHFVEFGELYVPEGACLSLPAGKYLALLSHSGSRGTGEAVAKYYSDIAMSLHPDLPDNIRHLAWLPMDSQSGLEYWNVMQLMGRYASANHHLIHNHVLAALGAKALAMVENHHNFAWIEEYDGEEFIIHRKGATPAAEGVLGVMPGSMGTAGFVVRGLGNRDAYNSCSHGSGRRMSRKAAFQNLDRSAWLALLKEKRIHLLSGALDEAPEAYKDSRSVIEAQRSLVDVVAEFHPRLVKMAPDAETKPRWLKEKEQTTLIAGEV